MSAHSPLDVHLYRVHIGHIRDARNKAALPADERSILSTVVSHVYLCDMCRGGGGGGGGRAGGEGYGSVCMSACRAHVDVAC